MLFHCVIFEFALVKVKTFFVVISVIYFVPFFSSSILFISLFIYLVIIYTR